MTVSSTVMPGENAQFSEIYLWKNYVPDKSGLPDIFAIIKMVNEKIRERVPAWDCFIESPENFPIFFNAVLKLALNDDLSFLEQIIVVTFLDNCFNSLEIDIIRQEVVKICSLPIWANLLPAQRTKLLNSNQKLKKYWIKVEKKFALLSGSELEAFDFNRRVLWRLLQKFKKVIDFIDDESKEFDVNTVIYCERFLLLLVDLEAQLTTRRFFNSLILSSHVIIHAHLSNLITAEYGSLFCELLSMLKFYARFEIDDVSGLPLSNAEMTKRHYDFVMNLQKASFKYFRETMKQFALLNVGSVDTRKFLWSHFESMSATDLYQIAEYLLLVSPRQADAKNESNDALVEENEADKNYGRYDDVHYLAEMIIFFCERRPSQLQKLNAQPLYPSERVIWDEKLVPYEHYDGASVLPLNKLNLQFLTLHDYLLRNFNLFQMESTYEIRQDLEDAMFRMRPFHHEMNADEVVWGGWARMALPLNECRIVWVAKPLVGEMCPAEVKADLTVTFPKRTDIRMEWEALRKNDVLFVVKVAAKAGFGTKFDVRKPFKEQIRVDCVRGCEVEGIIGPEGQVLDEMESREVVHKMSGDSRTVRVCFDPNQYLLDVEENDGKSADLYYSFNLLVRRDPKTNNFKAVLATIRQLLNTECVVPDWLHDIILGYGEPDAAHYSRLVNNSVATLNFNDTFLSYDHLVASFPGKNVVCTEKDPKPPLRLTFRELVPQHAIADADQRDTSIVVHSEAERLRHAHRLRAIADTARLENVEEIRRNTIEFTAAQVEAIKSGMEPGLTMVVGPPGTGKTDVAVQIISNIYHNWPEQRTLIVTHSNQALNQLFEKIIALDVDERHLLRMGHGEEALETEKDFSRYGRVNYVLNERNALLNRVQRLSTLLNEVGDVGYSCETAGYFYRYTVIRTWDYFVECYEKFRESIVNNKSPEAVKMREKQKATEMEVEATENGDGGKDAVEEPEDGEIPVFASDWVAKNFPFTGFFVKEDGGSGSALFEGKDLEEDFQMAKACWQQIEAMFCKLDEFMAFELLRNGRDRADYLLVKEAKIIAMTCTHAALRRKELVDLGFRYDNILMEEAAQILEVETFIPLLLQDPHDGRNRLKRWIMIGDHHQLPPVVQNVAYQKYANMEQSLFARLIRLGVPYVELDAQGRARADIAQLYNFCYRRLTDLPHVLAVPRFCLANAGFRYTFQFIDVPDFNGVGESTPSPYFYQNLGEAEYAVGLFMYMRIIGYPAERISIITTYNGQASLIRDIVARRCGANPLIGTPAKISTVDKFQGQQNDYIILSLVRTRAVGHLRDIRRLVVALSRARLGLYVLGRLKLFRNCYELKSAFKRLTARPTLLMLVPHECFVADDALATEEPQRKWDEAPEDSESVMEIVDTAHLHHFVEQFYASNVELLKRRFADEHDGMDVETVVARQATAAGGGGNFVNSAGYQRPKRNHRPQQKRRAGQTLPEVHVADVVQMKVGGDASTTTVTSQADGEEQLAVAERLKPAEASEAPIVFEQIDFERLQEPPKYG